MSYLSSHQNDDTVSGAHGWLLSMMLAFLAPMGICRGLTTVPAILTKLQKGRGPARIELLLIASFGLARALVFVPLAATAGGVICALATELSSMLQSC